MRQADSPSRIESLDMLRGLAALAVVIAHTTIYGLHQPPLWDCLKWTPLRVLWSGHQAVILFFTLSGFALARMLLSTQKPMTYSSFVLNRIVRLYPPYIASIAIAFLVYRTLHIAGFQWSAGWMNTVYPFLDLQLLLQHALLLGNFNTAFINPPIWSIVHEMRLSLIFPLLLVAVQRYGLMSISAFACSSVAIGSLCISGALASDADLRLHPLLTLHYALFFVLGISIAQHVDTLKQWSRSLKRKQRYLFWLMGLVLYAYPFDSPWSPGMRIFGDLFIGLGSAIIIVLSLAFDGSRLGNIFAKVGRISYSLYLNHYVVIVAAAILLYPSFGSIAVWLVALPCSIAMAYILYIGIEQPATNKARRLRLNITVKRSTDT